ncbi:hypothetical protein EDD11_003008 [Mortierella claussenii]|nr:hypothetical protein EDD11_003008 [Mortierella claussenii]
MILIYLPCICVDIFRVVMELFKDEAPRTVENFRALCTGEKGISKISGVPLHYRGSIFHRVIKGFMIQGGDFTRRDGTGGESIYGAPLQDEGGFKRKHDIEGLLSMANKGPNTSSSQFFLTTRPTPHLDGKHVVFGRIVKGYEVIEKVENTPTDERNDRPLSIAMIANCGELELRIPPKHLEQQKQKKVGDTAQKSSSKETKKHADHSGSEGENLNNDTLRRSRSKSRQALVSGSEKESFHQRSRSSKHDRKRRRSSRDLDSRSRSRSRSRSEGRSRSRNRRDTKRSIRPDSGSPPLSKEREARRGNESARRSLSPRREGISTVASQSKANPPKQRVRSRSPEIKYKGRGAMKYREGRPRW